MFDAPPTQMFMSDAHHSDLLFCIGSNPKVSNLMRNYREAMARFGKEGACRLIVADPRVSDTAKVALLQEYGVVASSFKLRKEAGAWRFVDIDF